ncbi:MAG TPA: hypothetical protein VFB21_09690 [Chthonomonadaceae bacterium]|nr:hypothetical protein [Chthonomonadaceae bacterium]
MAAGLKRGKEVSPPVIIGVLAVVLIILAALAWRSSQPPSDPLAGMTLQQQAEALKKAQKDLQSAPPSPILGH